MELHRFAVEEKMTAEKLASLIQSKYNTKQDPITLDDARQIVSALLGTSKNDYHDVIMKLLGYFMDAGEIPYGTAKARDGDPDQWIFKRLQQEFKKELDALQ